MKHRRSIRLPNYDYSQNGAYFVTICTVNREHFFWNIVEGTKYCAPTVQLTDFWKIAEQCWHEIPDHYPYVELDAFVVMPNHLHGIISIVGAQYFVSNEEPINEFQKIIPWSISSIVRGYKIGVTKRCREISPWIEIWQWNFYEHIIRDEADLNRIREYIMNNPINWSDDEMNNGP
jgi:putative transposase